MEKKYSIAEDLQIILNSDEVQQFIKAAERFVDILRNENIGIKDFVDVSSLCLAELYYRSRLLPKISRKHSTIADYDPSFIEWGYACTIDKLDNLLTYYFINPYPDNETEDPPSVVKKSMSTDFLYIFFDVAVCLGHISQGTNGAVEQGLIAIKSKFNSHLGIKCLNVLDVLQYLKLWKSKDLETCKTILL